MKRAQAALEFLMTYGWAILVVLVVIGALAYFGVLNPSILLPEKCTLETGLNCKDHRIVQGANEVYLELENGKGKGIVVTGINVDGDIFTGCSGDTDTPDEPPWNDDWNAVNLGAHIENGNSDIFRIPCTSIAQYDGKTKANIEISWYFDDSSTTFLHTMKGELLAKVE